jgi:hypothetical protein
VVTYYIAVIVMSLTFSAPASFQGQVELLEFCSDNPVMTSIITFSVIKI